MILSKADTAINAALAALGVAGARIRLHDILVEEVSLVDRAANKRRFLVVKQGCPTMNESASAEKIVLSTQIKEGLLQAITPALERLVAVTTVVKGATESDEGGSTVPEATSQEIDVVAGMLRDALTKFGSTNPAVVIAGFEEKVVKQLSEIGSEAGDKLKVLADIIHMIAEAASPQELEELHMRACGGGGGRSKEEKAVWSTAFVNNLPDMAFAYIAPGGKKDSEGKTVPRSLRHLPHHGAGVKSATEDSSVDLPHLRNALAREPQADISPAAHAAAKRHLEAHAKNLLSTRKANDLLPAELAKAADQAVALAAECASAEDITPECISKLHDLVAAVNALAETYPNPVSGGDMNTTKNETPVTPEIPAAAPGGQTPPAATGDQPPPAGETPEGATVDKNATPVVPAPAAPATTPDPAAPAAPAEVASDLANATEKAVEALSGSIADVAKRGAKMAGTRLRKLRSAVAALGELLDDLDEAPAQAAKRAEESSANAPLREPGDLGNVGSGGPPDVRNDQAENLPAVQAVLKRVEGLETAVKKLAETPEPPASRAEEAVNQSHGSNGGQRRRSGGPWIF